MSFQVQFRMRVYRDGDIAIGPGKVALLEAIASAGSISGAARQIQMSYRRAWLLVDELNQALTSPAVTTATGGVKGGGAQLTPLGEELVSRYRAMEATARQAAAADIKALTRLIAP